MKEFSENNYLTVPGFAICRLKLSGNELLAYSLVYGFCQDGETEFYGSLNYVASVLHVTKGNARNILERLCSKGYLQKRDFYVQGVKFCRYAVTDPACLKQTPPVSETDTPPVSETDTHNIDKDISTSDKDIDILRERMRKTSENACLFVDSKFFDYDRFKAEFSGDDFRGIDIAYYYGKIRDWSANKGAKKKDWIATTRNFIRGDMEAGGVKLVREGGGLMDTDMVEYIERMNRV